MFGIDLRFFRNSLKFYLARHLFDLDSNRTFD